MLSAPSASVIEVGEQLLDGHPHRGQLGPVQGRGLRTGPGAGLIGQEGVIHHPQPAPPQPVAGLPPGDADHPGPSRRLAPEGARPAPDGEHRVLHDLLGQHPVAGHQYDLPEHHPSVPPVERGHRVGVTLADPVQQRGIAAGRTGPGRDSGGAGIPVRIIHVTSPKDSLGE